MSQQPRGSLGRVLDDLGATLLDLVHGEVVSSERIAGIAIHDPFDEPHLPRPALVLGVGLREPAEIAGLLRALGPHGAAGLIVRAPVPAGDELRAAAHESGVALLALTRGASWAQLAALLRSMLSQGDVGDAGPEMLGGLPSGDLFALANAVAALVDAPVTIEDPDSRVLAFSGRQEEADESRVETILGRQVPERFARVLSRAGVLRDLHHSADPVFITPPPTAPGEFSVPRVAVAVRAGDEFLGSIWAAVHEPLTPDRSRAFSDAAKLVALHMLRLRAGADVERRLRTELVGTALEGGAGARESLARLGLADQALVVLALAPAEPEGAADRSGLAADRQRLADALAMQLSAVHAGSAVALLGDVAYGLLPVATAERAVRVAGEFLDRVGERVPALVGVGPPASSVAGLAAARASADRALRVLRSGCGLRVARLEDVYTKAMVLELRDLVAARGDAPTGPLARLLAYDAEHNANLVETFAAWLDAFGDAVAAAAALHVHPNTFRYRLRRLAEVGEVDLADPEARFGAMLQLRVFRGLA
ncbi:PucR family transcriptional regulator [Paractinoplanes hotanensis]|uniref:Helix-turn-helix domain-containing protein n=1 Tax=Paractinoplanes hotanensis TaxID=2906497 RepID=A0ABT0Y9E2_9ACTN|nr:helix-turn-helix domain-containing protein [Actinoplanes hotanensis]MCM4082664.1 helix-turn-helix domain-containing protein [Actinoplanes hotanensis]